MGPRGMRGMGHGRQRTNWNSSNRGSRLPDDWPERRAKVRGRAHGLCQAKQHVPECDGIGTDCDHIIAGDDHSLDNLQWLSHPCHKAKTERENAERNAKRKRMRKTSGGTFPRPARLTQAGWEGLPGLPVKPPDSTSGHACAQNARFSRYLIFIGTFPAVPFLAALFAVWSQVAFSRGSDRLVGARFFM